MLGKKFSKNKEKLDTDEEDKIFKKQTSNKGNEILERLKSKIKNPKNILIGLCVWYVETPFAIAIHLHKNLFDLYVNPLNLIEGFFHISVIWGLIKFNIVIGIIVLALFWAMHLSGNDYEDGKIIDLRKFKLLKSMMSTKQEENIKWSDRGDYGTAKWIETEKQVKELSGLVEISSEKPEKNGVILGYLRGTNKTITLPADSYLNQNIAVFGSSGSMKSRSYIIPNILNLMKSGESMIITDPKGGATRSYLKRVSTQAPMQNIA